MSTVPVMDGSRGRVLASLASTGGRGRVGHDDPPAEPNSNAEFSVVTDGNGGGAQELAHREEVAGASLSSRHGGTRREFRAEHDDLPVE